MKKSAQNRIIIWSIVSFLLIFILIAGFVVNAGGRYIPSINDRTYRTYYEEETGSEIFEAYDKAGGLGYSCDELSSIEINLSNGKVIFEENDSDIIEIVQLGNSSSDEISYYDQFYYQYDGMSLQIYGSNEDFELQNQDFLSSDFTLFFENFLKKVPDKTILVKIPKNAYVNNISINTASSDVEIDNVDTDYYSINSFSGYIKAQSVKSPSISIQNVSGNINLNNITSDELSVNNISGYADIKGDIVNLTYDGISGDLSYSTDSLNTDSISVNTVSGNTNITLPENSGFTVINSSLSGEIKSGFKGRTVDEHYIYGDGSTDIELNSVSGSININPLKDEKAEQEKVEQKRNEKKEASTSSTSQTQPTIAKATKSND